MKWRQLCLMAFMGLLVSCRSTTDTKTESNILALMETVPTGPHCGIGVPWYIYESKQQSTATLVILRKLYLGHKDARVRELAISCLSHQKQVDLVDFWGGILKDTGNQGRWPYAVRGLGTINTPQSNGILLAIASEATAPPDLLALVCRVLSETAPEGALAPVSGLTTHPSATVRRAAFRAVIALGADGDGMLWRILSDDDEEVVTFGLRRLGPNPSMGFVPLVLELLRNANPGVRAQADEALLYLLCHSSENIPHRFELLQQAFMSNQWDYARAPLLASRFAVVLETKGRLKEAAEAYETAEAALSTNANYRCRNDNAGATMLYRLFQVRRKLGDTDGARRVLSRMTSGYPADASVYVEDNPLVPGLSSHMDFPVREVTARLGNYLERVPIAVTAVALNSTVAAEDRPRFTHTLRNTTGNVLTLLCARQNTEAALMPACRPSVVMDDRHWMDIDESLRLAGRPIEEVKLKPSESFSFPGTLRPVTKGTHVFAIRFKPECRTGSGSNWSEYVMANSVVVEVK